MKTDDEELQKKIEAGDLFDRSVDGEAYRRVFAALKQDKGFDFPPSFAEKVIQKIRAAEAKREAARDFWWLFSGIFIFLGVFIFSLTRVTYKPNIGIYTFFSGYYGLIIFGITFIALLHFLDKRFLRRTS